MISNSINGISLLPWFIIITIIISHIRAYRIGRMDEVRKDRRFNENIVLYQNNFWGHMYFIGCVFLGFFFLFTDLVFTIVSFFEKLGDFIPDLPF